MLSPMCSGKVRSIPQQVHPRRRPTYQTPLGIVLSRKALTQIEMERSHIHWAGNEDGFGPGYHMYWPKIHYGSIGDLFGYW